MNRFCLAIVWIAWMIDSFATSAFGQSQYTPELLHQHFQNEAEQYVIAMDTGRLAEMRKQPLLLWHNTVRQQEQGALYVWLDDGAPVALASIFSFEYQGKVHCKHECISFADKGLVARMGPQVVWSPTRSGVDWRELNDWQTPGETPARRLTQMRSLCREFTARVIRPEGDSSNLQLLSQPLLRYQSSSKKIVDGGIFAFAVVTDPELLLIIEAYNDGASRKWRYAVGRSHYWQLELNRNQRQVWTADLDIALQSTNFNDASHSRKPYFSFHPPQDLPAPENIK